MKWVLAFCLLVVSAAAGAVIIRADVEDAGYRVPTSALPALVDLPGEGQGVLIAPQWVVTAAHAAPMQRQGMDEQVSIGGAAREVKRVVTYPGYEKLPDRLIQEALSTGDLSKLAAFLASSNDIALIQLASPVTDVAPIALYRGDQEVGMTAELVGKGASGNGSAGQELRSPHRTVLRHAFNVIVGADQRYVWYRFDSPPSALPLEGITGSGDSGGPLLIGDGSSRRLIGLASWSKYPPDHPFWKTWTPDRPFVEGLYGQIVHAVRISRYIPWIESVISASAGPRPQQQAAEANSPSSAVATRTPDL
ncbi:S1 family peptidase [Xanthomonas theicola]|uniref:Trypsin n=1 Tax=Xanthomonas theicola TaxID=56464 RepID=A0A2S6ZE56_9XANT|nr:trypsin-like serine protease [Xanthomonas theicola]PPT90522.1 trypsin [Xanthomonas theicola]QNH26829.1 trypsin-like serine protease [Xanthomonas theicola]